jgi:hypothetical protein
MSSKALVLSLAFGAALALVSGCKGPEDRRKDLAREIGEVHKECVVTADDVYHESLSLLCSKGPEFDAARLDLESRCASLVQLGFKQMEIWAGDEWWLKHLKEGELCPLERVR